MPHDIYLSTELISSYIEKYQSGGVVKLVQTNYQGRMCRLSESQQAKLYEEVESKIYLTMYSVIEYIRESF